MTSYTSSLSLVSSQHLVVIDIIYVGFDNNALPVTSLMLVGLTWYASFEHWIWLFEISERENISGFRRLVLGIS